MNRFRTGLPGIIIMMLAFSQASTVNRLNAIRPRSTPPRLAPSVTRTKFRLGSRRHTFRLLNSSAATRKRNRFVATLAYDPSNAVTFASIATLRRRKSMVE